MADYDSINDMENDGRIEEAKQFLRLCSDVDSNNRAEALDDLRFGLGSDQWPVETQNSRNLEARPCLTINKLAAYINQICNQQRQQRPRIKVHGMNNDSDAKVATILTGVCRHIETQSNADHAYDEAFKYAVTMGFGYFRVATDYISPDSFEQEIYIRPIENPFTVYFDPNSLLPDGSDAEKVLITTLMSKKSFKVMYPNAEVDQGFNSRGTGDTNNEWVMKEDIRVAEYFYTVKKKASLVLLSDGTSVYEDELPDADLLMKAGIFEVSRRDSYKKEVHWCKLTGMQILEEGIWAGKYIPVIPVYGVQLTIDSKRKKFGVVRNAKDPQRMYNYWATSLTESVALAPKAKWVMAEGQDEGHENEWAQANIKSMSYLTYKQTDILGKDAPPPTRMQPEPPPTGAMAALQGMSADLQAVVGIYDPSELPQGNISGKALQGQQQQVDMVNFHFYDNLTRSIAYCGRIILDLIPKIYDTERVLRIIGDDGKPELVTLNQRSTDENGVEKILNDTSVGRYDVVMDTGPGYDSKRAEAVEAMTSLFAADPQLVQVAGDLFVRNMDFPGADIIADRLAINNPLAQIDDKSEVPVQVQMQIAQGKQTIQQLQQQVQQLQMAMKQRSDIEQVKQEAMTKRELMKQTAYAHDIEMTNETKRRDVDARVETTANDTLLKSQTQIDIEHIKGQFALLLAKIDAKSLNEASSETTERAI